MSSISVKWQGVSSALDRYGSYQMELSGSAAAIRSIKSYRCMRGREFEGLYRALDRIITSLENEKRGIVNLHNGLSDVLRTYNACEKELCSENAFTWSLKDTWSVISKAGILGSAVATIGNLITGEWGPKTVIGSLKNLLSMVGGISGTVAKGANADWVKSIFGLTNGLNGLDDTSFMNTFSSSLEKQLDDLFLSTGAKAADKIKVATKWGGYMLSLGSNAIDNYAEFKGQEGQEGRMIAETLLETGTDIGLGMLATAGVSAVAAALVSAGVITAAPAIAIGAASVGVVWAANSVCKWITGGDDIGEVVSNMVCDGYEAVKNGFDSAVQWGKSFFGFG